MPHSDKIEQNRQKENGELPGVNLARLPLNSLKTLIKCMFYKFNEATG